MTEAESGTLRLITRGLSPTGYLRSTHQCSRFFPCRANSVIAVAWWNMMN